MIAHHSGYTIPSSAVDLRWTHHMDDLVGVISYKKFHRLQICTVGRIFLIGAKSHCI